MPSIGRTFSRLIEKMKKFITKLLPRSIDSRFLFDRSKLTFDRSKGILDWSDNEEFYHRVSTWLDRFSIPLRSIEKYIRSIERNSWSIETRITKFFLNFPTTVFDIFIVIPSKTHFWFYEWRFTDQTLRFSR